MNWVSSIDTIEITNITDKKIFLLKQKDPRGFELRFPNRPVEPGKTELIEIIFMPKEKGIFNLSFPIYYSASQTPVNITYKGSILSFDEFADVACPSFTKQNLKPVDFELEINVSDSVTKKPLGNSFIELTKGEFFEQHLSDGSGTFREKSNISYYMVLAEHAGYAGRSVARHVNPKNRIINIELPPLEKQKIIIPKDTLLLTIRDTLTPPSPIAPGFSISEYKRNNIVFLIDKSSSMSKPDCLPLLQAAMKELTGVLRAEDRITIMTYANETKVLLGGITGDQHDKIVTVINQLQCGGRTDGGKAIYAAYKNAKENFIRGGINQVIIATDGGFNGLSENEEELMRQVSDELQAGIGLSVLAFGTNRYGKAMIMRLAKQGGGFYSFIANEAGADEKLTDAIRLRSKIK